MSLGEAILALKKIADQIDWYILNENPSAYYAELIEILNIINEMEVPELIGDDNVHV